MAAAVPPTRTASGKMRCRWAAEERTCSHSGNFEVIFGIVPPEVIPLRIGILRVRESDAEDLLHDCAVFEGSGTQLSPILSLAAVDQIVEGGKRVLLMIQMPMQHGLPFPKTPLARVDNHGKHITNEWLCYCDFDVLLCGYSIVNLFYRPQRTTIWVPGATMVPAAGACSRTVPLPVIWTSSPAAAACSMTLRTGRPMSDGTRSFFASATVTVAASGGCLAVGWLAAVGALPGAA